MHETKISERVARLEEDFDGLAHAFHHHIKHQVDSGSSCEDEIMLSTANKRLESIVRKFEKLNSET